MTPHPQPAVDPAGLRDDVLGRFVRRQRGDWSAEDEAGFQAWLASDPRHLAAHVQWESRWQALDGLPAEAVAALRGRLAIDKARARAAAPRRRAVLAGAGVAALVAATGLAGWHHWQAQPVYAQAFESPRGQQIDVHLPDGSQLRLDTATRLEVTYRRHRREAKLIEGQVHFSVQADAARPFQVLAGPVGVTVVGTRFSVRHTPHQEGATGVRIAVEEGRVAVTGLPASGDPVMLTAGQQVDADDQGRLLAVARVASEGVAPWRDNRISFVDTPLTQALAELERYGNTGFVVRDPAVAALRLSGTFDPRDARTLRRVLPAALPVRLQATDGLTEVVPAR
jgi:transmembrane sensor